MRTDSTRRRCLAAFLACASLAGQAAENPPAGALALADTMQLSEAAKTAFIGKTATKVQRGEKSQQELHCLRAADYSVINVEYAAAFARSLSEAEIDSALKYFSSEAGRRYMQNWSLQRFEPLTEQDYAGAGEFFGSEAGRKLLPILMDESGLRNRLVPRLIPVLERCMEKKSAAEYFDELAPATPAEDKSPPASKEALRQLIRAMRDDEAFVLAFQQQLPAHGDRISKRDADCIKGMKPAQITDAFAAGIAGRLTSSEVTDALAFYESKAGQGFTRGSIAQLNLPPGRQVSMLDYMTADQLLEMKEFVKKPIARKLMMDKLTQQKSVMEGVQRRLLQIVQECSRKSASDR